MDTNNQNIDQEFEKRMAGYQAKADLETERKMAELNEAMPREEIFRRLAESKKPFLVPSGISSLDASIEGFESGSTYILGGIPKSGKTVFMMNLVDNFLTNGERVGYVDTELFKHKFVRRMSAISENIHESDKNNTPELQRNWEQVFIESEQLQYAELQDLEDKDGISFNKTIGIIESWKNNGMRICVFDNVTTIQDKLGKDKKGWEILREFVGGLRNYASRSNIVLFLVLHVRDNLNLTINADRLQKIFEEKTPQKIFQKVVTMQSRPTANNLFGGTGMRSQITGGVMLLWRPFPNHSDLRFKTATQLILEEWRNERLTHNPEIVLNFDRNSSRYLAVEGCDNCRDLNPKPEVCYLCKKEWQNE